MARFPEFRARLFANKRTGNALTAKSASVMCLLTLTAMCFATFAKTRGLPLGALQDFRNMIVNKITGMPAEAQAQGTARQTYIALGTLLTSAAPLEVDACGMEGIDPQQFVEILGLTGTEYATVAGVALGYRSPEDKTQFAKKVRFAPEQIFVTV